MKEILNKLTKIHKNGTFDGVFTHGLGRLEVIQNQINFNELLDCLNQI